MREDELERCAETLRSFLPRMSMQTALAWSEMLALERVELLTVREVDSMTGEVIERETVGLTLTEVRVAAMRVAREMGPQDWPAPRTLIDACRAVRRERVREQRKERPLQQIPARASLSDAERDRNAQRARETMAYVKEKLGIAFDVQQRNKPEPVRLVEVSAEERARVEARRAELRAQAAMLMGAWTDE